MTHEELKNIAAEYLQEVVIFPDLEPALVGYMWDILQDGSEIMRAVYDYYKILDCLVKQGRSDEEAVDWFSYNTLRTAQYVKGGPKFLYTNP